MARDPTNWLVFGGAVVTAALIAAGVALPGVVGAEQWVTLFPWSDPSWGVRDWAVVDVEGTPALLVHQRTEWGEDGQAERVVLLSRATGATLGAYYAFGSLEVRAFRPGRLWIQDPHGHVALRVPDLSVDVRLQELLERFPEVSGEGARADFVADTDTVRLTLADGFQWDVSADLSRVTKLHHDTVTASTPSFGDSTVSCPHEATLPSGRVALLSQQSARPALRVAAARGALEAEEVETAFEGFLEGVFLCGSDRSAILRPPETVFITHHGDHHGELDLLISRVDAEGLSWSRGVRGLDPGLQGRERLDLALAEDRGDMIVVWARASQYAGFGSPGRDVLVALDVSHGEVRWQTVF